ncbi:ribosomal RNA small subunit methyltransferase B [Haloferula helveola]
MGQAFRENRKWGKRDRHFVAESVWEVVRWKRVFSFLADTEDPAGWLAAFWQQSGYECPEWWQWEGATLEEMAERRAALGEQPRAVRESYPDWLDTRAEEEIGDSWSSIASALNRKAPVFLRVNRAESGRAEVREWLNEQGVGCSEVAEAPDALKLDDSLPRALFQDPRFEIQDGGSQLIAPFLDIQPGMRVIDACAGAGGKTLHLASLMQGKGEIVALDVSQRRLDELWRRAKRAGLRNLKVEKWSDMGLSKWTGWADRVLIDAPCSGLGTIRRQPDLKWRLDEKGLGKVIRVQRRLLDHYPELLRAGGSFVYATCSVLPSENETQIGNLLERDGRWETEASRAVHPGEHDFDGFFMARLRAR